MLTLRVKLEFATFRKPFAREYRATEPLPPPSTCYGFLLSLTGIPRERYNEHIGVRIAPALLSKPEKSVILRKIMRMKSRDGVGNSTPDYQEILTGLDLLIFLDSSEEKAAITLEQKVSAALRDPSSIDRFGPLCLGESDSLVNSVDIVEGIDADWRPKCFLLSPNGMMSLTSWPDYGQCLNVRWAKGDLMEIHSPPSLEQMPFIAPPG